MEFFKNLKRAMIAFAIASNPTMVRYMDMDYVRAILNGEVEI